MAAPPPHEHPTPAPAYLGPARASGGQESLGEDYFECVLPLQDEYRDCVYAALTCGDDWFVPCEDAYEGNVLDTCPMLPSDVASDYAACLPG